MVSVRLKDGSERQFPEGTTLLQAIESVNKKLAKESLVARFNGRLVDLNQPLNEDGVLELLGFEDPAGQDVYRHSSSHIMAQAVKRLWPDTQLAIGPAIDKGFYYDFDSTHTFTPEDFEAIEAEMNNIIKADYPIIRKEMPREEAIRFFKERGENYKVELIEDLPEDALISLYQQGEFVDLCAGPHVPSTGKVKAVKLMSVAGAYWRGSEDNAMLHVFTPLLSPRKHSWMITCTSWKRPKSVTTATGGGSWARSLQWMKDPASVFAQGHDNSQ